MPPERFRFLLSGTTPRGFGGRASLFLAAVFVLGSCGPWLSSAGCDPAAPQELTVSATLGKPPASGEPGATWRSPQDGMVLVYVPAGDFLMGASSADPNALENETPAHRVYLDAFWLDSTEVTNAMYSRCVADGKCAPPTADTSFSRSSYASQSTCAGYPVIYVSWQQTQDYCQWAGRRLPTEAEWEKAARGTDGRLFPWGNQNPTDAMANLCGSECRMEPRDPGINDGFLDTAPVGFLPGDSSPYGALDMAGNVAEWVADRGQADYYSVSPKSNPTGASAGDTRVIRGGVFAIVPRGARLSARSFLLPSASNQYTGFRCAAIAGP